jgi:hypothetical protein
MMPNPIAAKKKIFCSRPKYIDNELGKAKIMKNKSFFSNKPLYLGW